LKVLNKLSVAVLALGLLVGGAVASKADFTVTTLPSDWTAGVTSDSGTFTNTLLFPVPNPQTFSGNSSFVVYGNNFTTGPVGSDTFTNVPAHLNFDVLCQGHTFSFTATGALNGGMSFNGTNGQSTTSITFSDLNGSSTLVTDPFTGNQALVVKEHFGGKNGPTVTDYVDVNQGIAAPFAAPATIQGGIVCVPELGTSMSLGAMLLGGCLFGRRIRRRS
jgi:hypothetical protein